MLSDLVVEPSAVAGSSGDTAAVMPSGAFRKYARPY